MYLIQLDAQWAESKQNEAEFLKESLINFSVEEAVAIVDMADAEFNSEQYLHHTFSELRHADYTKITYGVLRVFQSKVQAMTIRNGRAAGLYPSHVIAYAVLQRWMECAIDEKRIREQPKATKEPVYSTTRLMKIDEAGVPRIVQNMTYLHGSMVFRLDLFDGTTEVVASEYLGDYMSIEAFQPSTEQWETIYPLAERYMENHYLLTRHE
jgi:hypothetical protein